ncbi:hypothetical protein [Microvirga yunnanensis]|nr:hypothetical protein [Microvirga sp. HBU65207]
MGKLFPDRAPSEGQCGVNRRLSVSGTDVEIRDIPGRRISKDFL